MDDSFDISGMYGIPPRGDLHVHCGSSPYVQPQNNMSQQRQTARQRQHMPNQGANFNPSTNSGMMDDNAMGQMMNTGGMVGAMGTGMGNSMGNGMGNSMGNTMGNMMGNTARNGMGSNMDSTAGGVGTPGLNQLDAEDAQSMMMQNMPSTGQRNMPVNQLAVVTNQNQRIAAMTPNYSNVVSVPGQSIEYLNGFLRTQVGKMTEVEFLIGTNNIVTKRGVLVGVGSNYILIKEDVTNDMLACDFYHINFVRFFE